ncbi:hypothetical protein AusDCA_0092 [Desulfitobacterium sp. AusDCA]
MPTEGVILSGTSQGVELEADRTLESSERAPKGQTAFAAISQAKGQRYEGKA